MIVAILIALWISGGIMGAALLNNNWSILISFATLFSAAAALWIWVERSDKG
jgi:hypothetical protein